MVPLLRARGVEVEILTSRPGDDVTEAEIVDGVSVQRVPIKNGPPSFWHRFSGVAPSYWDRLSKVIGAMIARRKSFDIALFHSHNNDLVYASCAVGRILGWKTVYKMTLLRSDDLKSIYSMGRFGRLRLAILRLADGYISMSRILMRGFEDASFLRNKLIVVPQGVDTDRFRPADPVRKRSLRRELGIPEDARVVLFCGGVVYRKGVDILVEAWHQVSAKERGAILLMVGPNHRNGLDEPEHRQFGEDMERRIKALGLDTSVRLLGYQGAPENFYAVSDVFVFPSRSEGWGAAVTEAMACGLPCVVSPLDGISEEQLRDGEEGVIVRSQDPEEYAAQLLRLLGDEETRGQMGQRARKRAADLFDVGRVADSYAAFLHRVCGTK